MKNKVNSQQEVTIRGTATSPGIAIGPAFIFKPYSINLSELDTKVQDISAEIRHFESAIKKVLESLTYAQINSEANYQNQFSEIFESQKAFLKDPVLIKEIKQEIDQSKHSAANVVSRILSGKSDYFINLENTYFRERAYDILDLKQKLVHALLGINIDYRLSNPAVVVAEMLSPSDTILFNRNFILGFLTDKGGKTSHAAIMARSLQIPSVVNGVNLSKIIQQGDFLIIDGLEGEVIINPSSSTRKKYEKLHHDYIRYKKALHKENRKKAITKDKQSIQLLANIEFSHEISDVKKNRAEGVGLFRTESIFIEKNGLPNEEEQFEVYKKLAEQLNPAGVVIRTIDLGGDKLIAGYTESDEMNPFLGWRAIRFCLDKPEIFKTQLRAILRAGAFGEIRILVPMVSSVNEIIHTQKLIEEAKTELLFNDMAFSNRIPLGIMIETPAAATMAHVFAKYVDFFSIGTNDLTQYVLAIDRTNDKVAHSYNTFNPSVLFLIANTIKAAQQNDIGVTLCGEFSAVPEAIPLLLGMGLRSFSMNPFSLPEVKIIIRNLDISECRVFYDSVKNLHTENEIEDKCRKFLNKRLPGLKLLKKEKN